MPFPYQDIHIYEPGPVYEIGESFTMGTVMNIIEKMNSAIPHHTFEPEPISEGGIRVKCNGEAYKTIRLCIKNWPWLRHGAETDLNRKLTCEKGLMCTYLKEFDGAAPWTKDEIRCIDIIFREEGMKRVRRT